MHLKMLLVSLLISLHVYSQSSPDPDYINIDSILLSNGGNAQKLSTERDSIAHGDNDTLIPFFKNKPLRLADYENRVIPFNSKLPLYVSITFRHSEATNLEYFREDSTRYLVYEYYKDPGPTYKTIKSSGRKVVKENISDSTSCSSHIIRGPKSYISIHTDYFKTFSKEGEWREYEDSSTYQIYWTGDYENDKKQGLWQRKMNFLNDIFIIEQICYNKDSAKSIPCANIANTLSLTALQRLLTSSWNLRSCDNEDEPRMIYYKYEQAKDPYKQIMMGQRYYHLEAKQKFIRELGEGCFEFREACIDGQWMLTETADNRYIIINFTNGQEWKLRVIYIDANRNLITERM